MIVTEYRIFGLDWIFGQRRWCLWWDGYEGNLWPDWEQGARKSARSWRRQRTGCWDFTLIGRQ